MKLECSLDLKDCTCKRNFCRKSNRVHPHSNNEILSYRQTQSASVSKHSDKNGTYLLVVMLCVAVCCIILPICGLWMGPLIYYIRLASGQISPTAVPTMFPTMSPTMVRTLSLTPHLLNLLNNTINNETNISI